MLGGTAKARTNAGQQREGYLDLTAEHIAHLGSVVD